MTSWRNLHTYIVHYVQNISIILRFYSIMFKIIVQMSNVRYIVIDTKYLILFTSNQNIL